MKKSSMLNNLCAEVKDPFTRFLIYRAIYKTGDYADGYIIIERYLLCHKLDYVGVIAIDYVEKCDLNPTIPIVDVYAQPTGHFYRKSSYRISLKW